MWTCFQRCEMFHQDTADQVLFYDVNGVHPDPEKCAEIQAIPAPKNVTEIQQFLGIIQVMAPFISKLADQTAPLRALTKKDVLPTEGFRERQSFHMQGHCSHVLRRHQTNHHPGRCIKDWNRRSSSPRRTSDSLCQQSPNRDRETVRQHRTRTPGVVFGCERFHTYVYGKPFVVETDHKPLEMIHKKSLASAPTRLQRMLLRPQHYDVIIKYRPGKEMVLADSLSRLSPTPDKEIHLQQSIYAVQFTDDKLQQLKRESESDPEVTAIRKYYI